MIIVSSRLNLLGMVIDMLQYFKQSATAPYNFVALPEKILPAQIERTEDYVDFIKSKGNLSGEIKLELETLTPLFIGDGNGSKSFAPVDKPIIPGSSLRGMFKNIFKVVTCGAFRGQTESQRKGEDFNDEHIYFRCLMKINKYPWTAELHKHYVELMNDKITKKKTARPGFLIRTTDGKYFIVKAIARKEDYIMIREYQERYGQLKHKDSRVHWVEGTAYCLTGNQWANNPERLLTREAYEEYKETLKALREKVKRRKMTKRDYENTAREYAREYGKQIIRYTSLDGAKWDEEWLEVPKDVLLSYERDRKRTRGGVNLIDSKFKENPSFKKRRELEPYVEKIFLDKVACLIPCHYMTDKNGQVAAFGHGQCFRVPYEKRIGDAVPEDLRDEAIVDFADAVFGKEKFWASRVYFEDATSEKVSELAEVTLHPLMQPNPTSFQLYLKQEGELKHWDSGAQIRGYKFYWHNDVSDKKFVWEANQRELAEDAERIQKNLEPLTKKRTPLAKGNVFTTKIRFKNLSKVELGALMMIFDLDGLKDAAYKIGQGKPFGFGSIKINKLELSVEDETTYTELFDGDAWKDPYRAESPAEYLDAFTDYLKSRGMFEAWQKVMAELKKFLNWSVTRRDNWSKQIEQMRGDFSQDGVNEKFKQRVPLQELKSIFEVVK